MATCHRSLTTPPGRLNKRVGIQGNLAMAEIEYVRQEDRDEYYRFIAHHLPSFGRALTPEIWHYTTAEGLIGILKTGRIWSTQVTCLNDALEQRYFSSLVHDAVKVRRAATTDPDISILLRIADEALTKADFAAVGNFVACFSEIEDDLGQWRGYGGGECGYAIGFRTEGILEAIKDRAILLPMHYEDQGHRFLVDEVLRLAETYFQQGLQRGLPDKERWAQEFIVAFAQALDIFASMVKHPKFASESERRIAINLQFGQHVEMEFRQKKTLLARHLPFDLTVPVGDQRRLPITRLFVGPGPSQRVSQVSVGDLLLKYGYPPEIKVELSKIPYRVP